MKHQHNEYAITTYRLRFEAFIESDNSDFDYRVYERSFSGCMCGQRFELTYKLNQVTITLTQSFNY